MEKLKFILTSFLVLIVIGLIGYWAMATMQSGSEHVANEKIKQLQNEKEDLQQEIEDLNKELDALRPKIEEVAVEETKQPDNTQPIIYKHQILIDELQKLVNDNIFMKVGSNGTRVGTIQRFLNIYNNTSNKVDNDYGTSTKNLVAAFQKAQGLNADGEAGANTFKKMIEWLKKNN